MTRRTQVNETNQRKDAKEEKKKKATTMKQK